MNPRLGFASAALMLLSAVLVDSACGGNSSVSRALQPMLVGRTQAGPSASCLTKACIYIVDPKFSSQQRDKVAVFRGNANGNVPPLQLISGSRTGLHSAQPVGIAVDGSNNIYVTSQTALRNSISVYAAGATGNVAPIRKIHGSKTRYRGGAGIALDANNNIYVAVSQHVLVYAAGADGNVAPIRDITGSNTGYGGEGLALDTGSNIYVANSTFNSVTVYAAGANGNVLPIQTIAGPHTGLNLPEGIAVDASSNIYVANSADNGPGTVTVYPAGSNGDVAPTQTIGGPMSKMNTPGGVAVDSGRNIYVANGGAYITVYAAGANGDVPPIQTIIGARTKLTGTFIGIAFH